MNTTYTIKIEMSNGEIRTIPGWSYNEGRDEMRRLALEWRTSAPARHYEIAGTFGTIDFGTTIKMQENRKVVSTITLIED